MKKLFTEEMLNKIKKANESVSGTSDYNKYYLCMEAKSENGRWFYVGWAIPHTTGYFKTIKEKLYVICTDCLGNIYRYTASNEVLELLEL